MDLSDRVALSPREAARCLSIGTTKLYTLIAAGKLDARSFGHRTLITRESVEQFLASLPPAPIGSARNGTRLRRAAIKTVSGDASLP